MKFSVGAIICIACAALAAIAIQPLEAKDKTKNVKPLTGYSVVIVAPFSTEKNETTKNFPDGEERMLKKNLLTMLQDEKTFKEVVEQDPENPAAPAAAPAASDKRRLILTGTVVSYSRGSSTARFILWPLPVAPTVVKVRFVFRDAESGQEIFQTEQRGKYNAIASLGVADKQESLAATKSGVARALLKEISKQR